MAAKVGPSRAYAGLGVEIVHVSIAPHLDFGFNASCRGLDWPATGTGNLISWDADENCQRIVYGSYGVHAVAGSFYTYAYGDGSLTITPNSVAGDSDFRVVDCDGEESLLSTPGGSVGSGATQGFNPCLSVVPVEGTTWGRIKARER